MPYSITTKDGITIKNIPDDVAPDAQSLKDRVAAIRAGNAAAVQKPEPSLMDRAGDLFTGNLRKTAETEALPDWAGMPELNDLVSVAGWKTAIGTLMSGPEETAKIIKANYPGVEVRQDANGNFVLKSASDGKEYAIKPGFQVSDIPRFIGGLAAFTPSGRATSILGAAGASAATQGAIEATQAGAGGEFNPKDVAIAGVSGAAIPAVVKVVSTAAPAVKSMLGMADNAPVSTAAPIAPAQAAADALAKETKAASNFGAMAKTAAGNGMGSQKAKEQLASLADINPEARAAADALGIDLPPDVISDSKLMQEVVGLSRSIQGSEASVAWGRTIEAARAKADDALAKIDASPDIATVSETIKGNLGKIRKDLDSAASLIYRQIDDVMPKDASVNMGKANMSRTQQTISDISREVGEGNLSAAEKRLNVLAADPNTTYGALLREKAQIGAALRGKLDANPYGSVETGSLKRLYGALSDDQLSAVEALAGNEARNNLRYANQLTAKKKALEARIVNAFGKEGEGSIATKLKSAIKTGSKGEITALNNVLKIIPADLRKEALSSALMAQARTARGDFSFGAFESMYQGLRKNGPVYAAVSKEIGPEGSELLRSLYVVSKRINTAENKILKTGKANQALVATLTADGIVKRVLSSTVGRVAATTAGGAMGGPLGGAAASTAANAISSGDKNVVAAVSKLLTSQEFEKLIQDAAEKGATKAAEGLAAKRLASSPAFIAYAKAAKIGKDVAARESWIRTAVLAAQPNKSEESKQ